MIRDELLEENANLHHQLNDLKRKRGALRKRLEHEIVEALYCLMPEPNLSMCRDRLNQALDALKADLL